MWLTGQFGQIHQKEYDTRAEVSVHIPGACTFAGIYADDCQGFCLTGAMGPGVDIAFSKRKDNLIKMFNANRTDRKHSQTNSIRFRKEDRWANFIKGVLFQLTSEMYILTGLDISVKGPLLYGDDRILASALGLGTLMCIEKLFSFELDYNIIVRMVYQSGVTFSHVRPRVQDIVTMMKSQEGKLLFFDLQSTTYSYVDYPFSQGDNQGYMIDSGLPSSMLRESFEDMEAEKEAALQDWQEAKGKPFFWKDLNSLDPFYGAESLPDGEKRVCRFLVNESKRAQDMVSCITHLDYAGMARIAKAQVDDLENLLGLSCPEMSWLLKHLGNSASFIQNGASGFVFFLSEKVALDPVRIQLENYERNFGFHPELIKYEIPDAVTVEKVYINENSAYE